MGETHEMVFSQEKIKTFNVKLKFLNQYLILF